MMQKKHLTKEILLPHGTIKYVIIDGCRARCEIGLFGTWSERLKITFKDIHPEFGKEFFTKHFSFIKPGVISWGHESKTMKIEIQNDE